MKKPFEAFLVLIAISGFLTIKQFASSPDVRLFTDTRDYTQGATFSVFSREFWTGSHYLAYDGTKIDSCCIGKAPLYAFVIQTFVGHTKEISAELQRFPWEAKSYVVSPWYQMLANFQLAAGLLAWALLAFAVFVTSRSRIAALAGAAAILLFSQQPDIVCAYRVVLTESLSITLLTMFLALSLLYWQYRRRFLLWFAAADLTFLSLLRDAEGYLAFMIVAGVLVAAGITYYRRRRGAEFFLPGAMVIAVFIFNNLICGSTPGRVGFDVYEIYRDRILPNPEARAWFTARGMPSDNFEAWRDLEGFGLYKRYLITHPAYVLTAFNDIDYLADGTLRLFPAYMKLDFENWPPLGSDGLALAVIASLVATAVGVRARNGAVYLLGFMLLLVVPHFLVVWHGDSVNLPRHLYLPSLHFKVTALLLVTYLADSVARRKEE